MECENLLRNFLILNSTKRSIPTKRGTFDQVKKDSWISWGHKIELKPYVELLTDCKEPWRAELIVSIGYTWKEIRDGPLMGQKSEVMATSLLLGHQSSELEGYTITSKPQPSANLTTSSSASPTHEVQNCLSANLNQWDFSDHAGPVIPISNSQNSQGSSTEKGGSRQRTRNQNKMPVARPTCPPLPYCPGEEENNSSKTAISPPAKAQNRNPRILVMAGLSQKEQSQTRLSSGASVSSTSAVVGRALPVCTRNPQQPWCSSARAQEW
ncbi:Serine/threonine-protein kinase MARK2 [Camelus dromedarius]|uniref:Serine/threonine-protein kinase MARK2 n=1 Tax=Camelus dromedarius TaxID=9838 RepID=A0A5N4DKJ2_CAMDR|nr:Serine/threonine-protein kinase MARK2 [Camelus dromedarius]